MRKPLALALAAALPLIAACSTTESEVTPGPAAAAPPEFEVVALEYAEAGPAARTLQNLLVDEPDVKLLADQRTNSLLVLAGHEEMPRVKEMIARLDVQVPGETGESATAESTSVALKHASAAEVARTVRELVNHAAAGGPHGANVKVVADERTNSVLVQGTGEQVENVKALIEKLDVAVE